MEANGLMLALLDIPADYTEEYNRWYDLDHMPEHVSKGDVLMGRRYVATRALRRAPGIQACEWLGGYPPYLTNYWFGGPLDFRGEEARGLWRTKDRGIVKAGRYWQVGRGVHSSHWRVEAATTRPSVLVDAAAVPYLAHRGIIVAIGRAPSPDRVGDAVTWWDDVHLVDLLSVDGLLAAVRFSPADEGEAVTEGMLLHLLFCEAPPGEVMSSIHHARRSWEAQGRYPAHGGVYEPIGLLPYQWIVPLEYDFDIRPPEDPTSITLGA